MSNLELNKVPHPIISSQGPLGEIERYLLANRSAIEHWIQNQLQNSPPPIYCSVDLRNSGFKSSPVDTNLFPAGFNNLSPDSTALCIQAVQSQMEEICQGIKNILLIPEDHTRNFYYYENIAKIMQIFAKAGYKLRIGSLLTDLAEAKEIELPSGGFITLEPLKRNGNQVGVDGFSSCLILLNNDLSAGVPEVLKGLNQLIIPPLSAGWYSRLKSNHFKHYRKVVAEFCERFDFDPWLISPLFRYCGEVNFMVKDGESCLVNHARDLLEEIKQKYDQYEIKQKPFLVVKADAGTYGMAVMMIQEPEDLTKLNRKERTRMASIKGSREVRKVIIQEGIPTCEKFGKEEFSAEPVIYMIGKQIVGGFYRIHAGKGVTENLNAPGMYFESFVFDNNHNQLYWYGVIARLALIAAARELAE